MEAIAAVISSFEIAGKFPLAARMSAPSSLLTHFIKSQAASFFCDSDTTERPVTAPNVVPASMPSA